MKESIHLLAEEQVEELREEKLHIVKHGKDLESNFLNYIRSLTSARVPCTAIERYPVVARWRNDVDYVAAGIYCF